MGRDEKVYELAELIDRLRGKIGFGYLPAADVRRYNQLMSELYDAGEYKEGQETENNEKENEK